MRMLLRGLLIAACVGLAGCGDVVKEGAVTESATLEEAAQKEGVWGQWRDEFIAGHIIPAMTKAP